MSVMKDQMQSLQRVLKAFNVIKLRCPTRHLNKPFFGTALYITDYYGVNTVCIPILVQNHVLEPFVCELCLFWLFQNWLITVRLPVQCEVKKLVFST